MSSMTPDDFDVDYDDLLLGKSRDPTPLHAPRRSRCQTSAGLGSETAPIQYWHSAGSLGWPFPVLKY